MSIQYALSMRKEERKKTKKKVGNKPKVWFPTKKCLLATVGKKKTNIVYKRIFSIFVSLPFSSLFSVFCRKNNWYFLSSFICRCIYSINFKLFCSKILFIFLCSNSSQFWFSIVFIATVGCRFTMQVNLSALSAYYIFSLAPLHYSSAVKITGKKSINTVHSPSITFNALKLLLLSRKMFRIFAKSNFLQLHLSIWFDATMGKMCTTNEHRAEIKTVQWKCEIQWTIQKMEKFFNCPTLLFSFFTCCWYGSLLFMCITFNDRIGLATVVRHK